MLLLSGCKKQVVKCNLISDQSASGYTMNVNINIYSKDNAVYKIVTEEEISSNNNTILSYFQKQFNDQYENYNKIYGGYTYKVNNKNGKVTAKVIIDYKKIDMKKFISANPAIKEYINKENNLLLDGAKKMYESTGAKCEK